MAANDFFGDLGETISKKAKGIGEKADVFFEIQKLQNRISSEQRLIDKTLGDLGNLVYKRFLDGEEMDGELVQICEEVTEHQKVITGYKESIARLKGRKICPACGADIDSDCDFCPRCGAPCPVVEEPEILEGVKEAEVADAGEADAPAESAEEAEETREPSGENIQEGTSAAE